MNTIDSLYRLYQKKGPSFFKDFIKENPVYFEMGKKVLEMAHKIV